MARDGPFQRSYGAARHAELTRYKPFSEITTAQLLGCKLVPVAPPRRGNESARAQRRSSATEYRPLLWIQSLVSRNPSILRSSATRSDSHLTLDVQPALWRHLAYELAGGVFECWRIADCCVPIHRSAPGIPSGLTRRSGKYRNGRFGAVSSIEVVRPPWTSAKWRSTAPPGRPAASPSLSIERSVRLPWDFVCVC